MSDLVIPTRIPRPATGTTLWGPDDRLLQIYEVEGLARIYWPATEIQHVVDISWCESGHRTGAWAWEGEDSRGLLQLNVAAHPDWIDFNLFDPQINCWFAHLLWVAEGWNPWTCAHELHIV